MRRLVALSLAAVLVLATVVAPVAARGPGGARHQGPLIGLVADGPTLFDRSYNEAAWLGVRLAARRIDGRAQALVAASADAYAANIATFAARGAKVIVSVGFLTTDATLAGAAAHPTIQFIGIDQGYPDPLPPNYQSLDFSRPQAGFLAGVVAGWVTGSSRVGAVGGMAIPPVIQLVDGYRNGVAWVAPGVSVDVAYAGAFDRPDLGYAVTEALIEGGADVVFGAAGGTNAGIFEASCEAGTWAIGVDVDQARQLPEYAGCILTSAENRVAAATRNAVLRWHAGRPGFQTGVYLNDASNLGIGLSPFRSTVPSLELVRKLAAAYMGLASGSIDPCAPTACDTP